MLVRLLVGLFMTAALFLAPPMLRAAARDCDANAVIYCGAETKAELIQKLQAGDGRHTAADIQAIFNSKGISAGEINQTVEGSVTRDGRVVVNGKTVATDARSLGRSFMAGSTRDGSVWSRLASVSFRSDSLPAFVLMDNGRFQWAVIKSCGNPVTAQPVIPVTPAAAKPSPPPQPLPQAGGEWLSSLGLGGLYWSVVGYLRSRRQVRRALLIRP